MNSCGDTSRRSVGFPHRGQMQCGNLLGMFYIGRPGQKDEAHRAGHLLTTLRVRCARHRLDTYPIA